MNYSEERFFNELTELDESSIRFENKEITAKEYKTVSCGFGTYMQRDQEHHMLRLRLFGGTLTKEQLACILESAEKHQISTVKISTGQTLQLHDLSPAAVRATAKEVLKAGIVTRGTGGSHPANVIAPPLSGVEKGEYFDVLPYAKAVHEYILSIVGTLKFPRKLKISFSSSLKNETHSTFRDLGFAANEDGTFDVYATGGLGVSPKMGILVKDHLAPEKILYYVRALMNVFIEHGDYEHRVRARSRYLQETLGEEKIRELVLQEVSRLEETENLDVHVEPKQIRKQGSGSIAENFRIREQKQAGLYAVYYHSTGGFFTIERLKEMYQAIREMEEVEIRLSIDGGLYFINCNAGEAAQLYKMTEKDSASTKFQTSIACVGRTRCAIGGCDSQKLLADCLQELSGDMEAMSVLPQIRISGCASSCSAHQSAVLGFRGGMKRSEDGPKQAFCVFWGGCEQLGSEKLTESDSFIFAEKIPAFLHELADMVKAVGMDFESWLPEHEEEMRALTDRYKIG
ncbi:MAG: nitrite/sulfite reductase [Eubacteriales bacterium]|nr:nitrite/sulfite reductase [Eubacteriales bacterium]